MAALATPLTTLKKSQGYPRGVRYCGICDQNTAEVTMLYHSLDDARVAINTCSPGLRTSVFSTRNPALGSLPLVILLQLVPLHGTTCDARLKNTNERFKPGSDLESALLTQRRTSTAPLPQPMSHPPGFGGSEGGETNQKDD